MILIFLSFGGGILFMNESSTDGDAEKGTTQNTQVVQPTAAPTATDDNDQPKDQKNVATKETVTATAEVPDEPKKYNRKERCTKKQCNITKEHRNQETNATEKCRKNQDNDTKKTQCNNKDQLSHPRQ